MKKLNTIIKILLIITLTSCFEKNTGLYQIIVDVDTLIRQNRRDTAMAIFGTLDITNAKQNEIAYYNILANRLKTIDKKHIDSLLRISENYYKTTNENSKLSEVYLWKATRYFKDKDMYDSALYFWGKANKLALEANDYYLSAQIYYLKGIFHIYERNLANAKVANELQMSYAEKSKNKRQIAYATLDKAIIYKDLNETDSAKTWLRLALLTANDIEPYDMAFIYNALGELTDREDSMIAKDNFLKALEIYPIIPAQINLAKAYLNENNFAQAETICNKGLQYEWPETKIDFLKILCQCKRLQNDNDAAINIQDRIISEKDSIIEILSTENKQIALRQYNNLKSKQPDDETNHTLLILIALFVGVIICGAYYHRTKQRNLHNEINNRDNEIQTLKQRLAEENTKTNAFVASGEKLYKHIISNGSIVSWTHDDMVNFIEYYRTLKPEFVKTLESGYHKLTPRYKIILILEDMNKQMADILTIMSFEESSYRSAKSRINSQKK